MATTTGGTTYVTSTDLVANYPTASLALANRVDVVASGGPNSIKTSGYTITLADILGGNKFLYNSASPGTFTLPTSGLVDGMVVDVAQIGAGALTVSGGTIVGTTVTTAQYQGLRFVYASTGTTWYSVAPSVTAPGLAIVTPTSIANSGGSASASGGAVTISGVTSVSLNGVFTSAYENYMIMFNVNGTTEIGSYLRFRLSGTDATTNYNYQHLNAEGTGITAIRVLATSAMDLNLVMRVTTNPGIYTVNLAAPALARNTALQGSGLDLSAGNTLLAYRAMSGNHSTATGYDGFTWYPGSGNGTGTIRVYGYKNS